MSPPRPETAPGARLAKLRTGLERLWRPKGLAEDVAQVWPGPSTGEAAVLFWRVKLLTSAVFCLVVLLLVAALVGCLAGDGPFAVPVFMATAALAFSTGGVSQGFRLWLLFRLGGWSTRGGGPVRRTEQPVRFWAWAAAGVLGLALYWAGAGLLVWMAVFHP